MNISGENLIPQQKFSPRGSHKNVATEGHAQDRRQIRQLFLTAFIYTGQ